MSFTRNLRVKASPLKAGTTLAGEGRRKTALDVGGRRLSARATCAIPAASRLDQQLENMGALYAPLPDAALRQRTARHCERL